MSRPNGGRSIQLRETAFESEHLCLICTTDLQHWALVMKTTLLDHLS